MIVAASPNDGCSRLVHGGRCTTQQLEFLRAQCTVLHALEKPRPWHYHELHNPWGAAASVFDSWGFLDLCQSTAIVESLVPILGPDIILYDSEWLPDPWQAQEAKEAFESDAYRCPVEPLAGATVFITFDAENARSSIEYRESAQGSSQQSRSRDLEPERVAVLDTGLPYRLRQEPIRAPATLAIRYFPATSRYIRAPHASVHRALTCRFPLLNYARLPLWLVCGTDRADNDFVTGFNTRAGFWTQARW